VSSSYRVLHVDAAASYRGGQRQLALLASEQVAAGMDVRCLVCCRQLHRELVSIGAAAEEWKGPVSPAGWSQLWSATRAGRNLLHAHDSRSHTALGILGPRSLRHRLVVHRRIDDPPRGRFITRWKYQRGHIISVSKAVDQVMRLYGITAARRTIQYSATKIPAELPAPSARTNDDPSLRLLTVGALVPHKGHATLLNALSKMAKPARLFLLGEGPLEPVLRAKVLALGLTEQVRIEPYTDQRAHMLFQECDLYVHPSLPVSRRSWIPRPAGWYPPGTVRDLRRSSTTSRPRAPSRTPLGNNRDRQRTTGWRADILPTACSPGSGRSMMDSYEWRIRPANF